MEENENLYDKIHELFGDFRDHLNIQEETIDIELQIEYFEASKEFKNNIDKDEVLLESGSIFSRELTIEEEKVILTKLASVDKVEAYRILEKYLQQPNPALREWGLLALQESRMLIKSKLLDQNQVFISTGLGGKGDKLRYFVVILAQDNKPFNQTQKKIIQNEFETTLNKYEAEIEKLNFSGHIATIMTIIPIHITIRNLINEAIDECNLYGNFLVRNYIITNVKTLDFDEINRFIESQGGTPVRRQEMDTSTSNQQQGVQQGSYVTTDQLNTVLTRYNYDMAKRDFAEANQEFRDPDAQDLLDIESARLAQSEIFQYGRVNSRVDDIVKEAAKKVTAKLNKFKALGARSVTERREKIKEAAIPEGQSIAKSGAKDDEETYSPTKGFASLVTDHRKKFKQRGMR